LKRFRVGLVGLGAAARQIHVPAYARLRPVEVVGGADPTARNTFPFPVFANAEELITATRPDVLCVLTPPDTHYGLVRLGLESGCHVFCEKPFVSTVEEADALIQLAERSGHVVAVNQEFRFMRIHEAAQQLIGQPEFGELLFLNAEQTFFTSADTEAGWRGRDVERTCKEFGIHVLDLCRFYFGEEPRAITASMPRPNDPSGPDRLNLIRLDFAGERVAQITLDRLTRGRHRYLTTRLDGTAGSIEAELGGHIAVSAGVRGGTRRPFVSADVSLGGHARLFHGERSRKIASDPLDVFTSATRRLFEAFLIAVERGRRPPCDARDNRLSLALVRAAYESSRRGMAIAL
jgi:predicted dehydrogenase